MVAEGILDFEMNGREPERNGNRDPWMAPHGVFRCKDRAEKVAGRDIDMWVSIAVEDDEHWRRLAAAIGRPELATDPRFATLAARKHNEDELEAIITAMDLAALCARGRGGAAKGGRRGGDPLDQQGPVRGSASGPARLLCRAGASGGRCAQAYRSTVAHEPDPVRGQKAGARSLGRTPTSLTGVLGLHGRRIGRNCARSGRAALAANAFAPPRWF